jgi:hypothetical protein
MADAVIYCLAQIVQSKLSLEASSDYQDLRRIVGHANMLDNLTAKLINLGYEHDTDDIYPNEAAVADGELDLLLEENHCTDPNFGAREDDQGSVASEDSECSEDFEDTDSCSDCTSDSAEDFEGDDDDGDTNYEYVYTSTYSTKAHSSKSVIQVSVQEVIEFHETKFMPPFLESEGHPPQIPSNGYR